MRAIATGRKARRRPALGIDSPCGKHVPIRHPAYHGVPKNVGLYPQICS